MKRRQFITGTAASLLTACQDYDSWFDVPPWLPINVLKPAMQQGHYLRQLKQLPIAQGERRVETLIIGSGLSGLTAAWRLKQQGYQDFLLLNNTDLKIFSPISLNNSINNDLFIGIKINEIDNINKEFIDVKFKIKNLNTHTHFYFCMKKQCLMILNKCYLQELQQQLVF